jgi:hypothetical protein
MRWSFGVGMSYRGSSPTKVSGIEAITPAMPLALPTGHQFNLFALEVFRIEIENGGVAPEYAKLTGRARLKTAKALARGMFEERKRQIDEVRRQTLLSAGALDTLADEAGGLIDLKKLDADYWAGIETEAQRRLLTTSPSDKWSSFPSTAGDQREWRVNRRHRELLMESKSNPKPNTALITEISKKLSDIRAVLKKNTAPTRVYPGWTNEVIHKKAAPNIEVFNSPPIIRTQSLSCRDEARQQRLECPPLEAKEMKKSELRDTAMHVLVKCSVKRAAVEMAAEDRRSLAQWLEIMIEDEYARRAKARGE